MHRAAPNQHIDCGESEFKDEKMGVTVPVKDSGTTSIRNEGRSLDLRVWRGAQGCSMPLCTPPGVITGPRQRSRHFLRRTRPAQPQSQARQRCKDTTDCDSHHRQYQALPNYEPQHTRATRTSRHAYAYLRSAYG